LSKGWVCLYRSLADHWIYQDEAYLKIWVTMLFKANHETKSTLFNGSLVTIERGQFVFGRDKFAAESNLPVSKIRRALKLLESDQMISQQNHSKYSIITITNYTDHQNTNQQTSQETASKPPANDQQTTTSKQLNNLTIKQERSKAFAKPNLTELESAFSGKVADPLGEANKFFNFYESKGWKVGNTKMKSWKHAVANWATRGNQNVSSGTSGRTYQTKSERADAKLADYLQQHS
jgi:hypothetical protein